MKLLTPIFVVGLSIGAYYLYINPTYTEVKVVRAEVNEYKNAVKQAKDAAAIQSRLVSLRDSFAKTDIERLEKMLPNKADNIGLLNDLNNLALRYGSGISNIRIGEDAADNSVTGTRASNYGTVTIDFSVDMTYTSFLNFLRDLEKNLRIADVASINFKSEDSDGYTFTLAVKTYWLK